MNEPKDEDYEMETARWTRRNAIQSSHAPYILNHSRLNDLALTPKVEERSYFANASFATTDDL